MAGAGAGYSLLVRWAGGQEATLLHDGKHFGLTPADLLLLSYYANGSICIYIVVFILFPA